jgi:hypothetical protein
LARIITVGARRKMAILDVLKRFIADIDPCFFCGNTET